MNKNSDGFEIYKDNSSEWRWRFFSNGYVTATSSESYKNKSDCLSALENIQKTASSSNVRFKES